MKKKYRKCRYETMQRNCGHKHSTRFNSMCMVGRGKCLYYIPISNLEYCDSDCKNQHFWIRISTDGIYEYYRCSQCEKYKKEKIVYVEL